MNIILLHYAAHPIVGGVENVIRQHSRMMAAAGHGVSVVAGRGAQVDADVKFVQVPLVDSQEQEVLAAKQHLDRGRIPDAFAELVARLESRLAQLFADTDWVFAHNVCSLNKNLPLTAALRRLAQAGSGPRMVLWHHDLAWTTPRYAAELHEGYPWDLLRRDWPEVIQVAVSKHRRHELAALLGVREERILAIPNGIEVEAFLKIGKEVGAFIREFNLLDAAPLILLPARITPRKNIEMALRVLARLREVHPQARLLITGPTGPHNSANAAYLDSLRGLQNDLQLGGSVVFLTVATERTVSDEAISDLYRLADVLLLPSREEGFGIPLLEAALAGIPAFCSEIETLGELGGQDVSYFRLDADPRQVAAKIMSVLDASRAYGFRKRVLRAYAWQRIYAHHLQPILKGRS